MSTFQRNGLSFHYSDLGGGLPFFFQHGLGGDIGQPLGLYAPAAGVRLICCDMRAHGQTRPLGDVQNLKIAVLADDLVGLLDELSIESAVLGGISLGAAVAANVVLRYPKRASGLVLARPAWIDGPLPENVLRYSTIAQLIRDLGPLEGPRQFSCSADFRAVERDSPNCARSLIGQFEEPRASECVARLERLARDTPCHDRALYQSIKVPTLVLGNRQDPIHPWSLAETLARLIPGAVLREITPKSVSLERHAADVQRALDDFFSCRFQAPR
jgi:pimeloyl-ACP methyl ester carboxylesterase